MSVNQKLDAALRERGWSTHDLARASTVSQPTCWRALHGSRPHRRNRLLIAGALGVQVHALFENERGQSPKELASGRSRHNPKTDLLEVNNDAHEYYGRA